MSLSEALRLTTEWTVKEYQRKGSLLLKEVVLRRHNLHTTFGLTAYAGAFQGSYTAPVYFVAEAWNPHLQNSGGLAVNATSVTFNVAIHVTGDVPGSSTIVLGLGTANQETVTWSAVTGSGPYTYTISPCTKTHAQNDPCVRGVLLSDTLAQVQSEVQYDSVNVPNQRMPSLGGYSSGNGNWIMQFFFSGSQLLLSGGASLLVGNAGLADNASVGAGNLHNHLTLGYTHTQGTDVEIDVSLTLANA